MRFTMMYGMLCWFYLHGFHSLWAWVVKLTGLADGQPTRAEHQHFRHLQKGDNICTTHTFSDLHLKQNLFYTLTVHCEGDLLYCTSMSLSRSLTYSMRVTVVPSPGLWLELQVSLASQTQCCCFPLSLSETGMHQRGTAQKQSRDEDKLIKKKQCIDININASWTGGDRVISEQARRNLMAFDAVHEMKGWDGITTDIHAWHLK